MYFDATLGAEAADGGADKEVWEPAEDGGGVGYGVVDGGCGEESVCEGEGDDALGAAGGVLECEEGAEAAAVEVDATDAEHVEEHVKAVAELCGRPVDRDLGRDDAVAALGEGEELEVERLGRADDGVEADEGLRVPPRAPVIVHPVLRVEGADAEKVARHPGAEIGIGQRAFHS